MFRRLLVTDLDRLQPKRICIIKPSALGDVVQTLPLLPVLKHRFPGAKISWVINRELRDLVDGHPALHESVPFDRRGGWSGWIRLLSALRQQRFDLVFDLQGLLRTAMMTAATGSAARVGLQTAREGSRFTQNCVIPDTQRQMPAHARYWRVAEVLGLGDMARETIIVTSDADQSWAKQLVIRLRRPVFAINPGARWTTKRWPIAKFAELSTRAMQRWSGSLVIVGSKAERTDAEQLREDCMVRMGDVDSSRIVNLAGQSNLKQLSALLKRVDYAISNDSGPMHLAAGLGTPTLGLFTCTSSVRSGPPGEQHEMVSSFVPCASSYHKTCPLRDSAHLACHDELSVDRVWRSLERLVEKNRSADRVA